MKARGLIFIIVSVRIKAIVLLVGHDHGVVIVAVMEEVNFAEEEQFTVDSVAVVVEFHVDLVVGINAHAVYNVAVYGFGEFGKTSVFVEHICVSVEATIVGEDRFHWRRSRDWCGSVCGSPGRFQLSLCSCRVRLDHLSCRRAPISCG